jgi:hypothetical protein
LFLCFCIEIFFEKKKKIRLVFGWVFLEFVEVSEKSLSVSAIDHTSVVIECTCIIYSTVRVPALDARSISQTKRHNYHSYKPYFVLKAVFHSSPSFILI